MVETRVKNVLSGGVRSAISLNRVSIEDRVYTGFDTEFKTLDHWRNDLLCLTTASERRILLRVREILIDHDVTNNPSGLLSKREKIPVTEQLLKAVVLVIRDLAGKKDVEVEKLISSLNDNPVLTRYVNRVGRWYSLSKGLDPARYSIGYLNVEGNDRRELSLKTLHDLSLKITEAKACRGMEV